MTNISIRSTWPGWPWMAAALAAVMATNAIETLAQPAAAGLVVWTYASGPLAGAERAAGLRLADTLLATAGVTVRWRLCEAANPCPRGGRVAAHHAHVLGAVVAHEIGHLLGLPHADRGIMRARLEIDDVLALRQGRLGFDAIEATRMRIAAVIEPLAVRAARR